MKKMIKNPMLMTDFYKTIHHLAYVPGLQFLTSYWTPRMSRKDGITKIVSFGPQYYVQKWLIDAFNEDFFNVPWEDVKAEYERLIGNTMSKQAADTKFLKDLHDLGYLPIEISVVEEGTRVPLRCPMIQIRNTVEGFGWLVNYIETLSSNNLWGPMTAATIAYQFREDGQKYYDMTVDKNDPNMPPMSAICGDFSMRGMMSVDSACAASAGHLLSFTGTATIPAIAWLESYYNADCENEIVGRGVPSTEHSVMSSYGRDGEFECYRHLIEDVFTSGPLSMVSDTYDYWNVITNYLPKLKDSIMKRDGKIIIRGDSGDPVDIICGEFGKNENEIITPVPTGTTVEDLDKYFSHYSLNENNDKEDVPELSVYYTKINDKYYKIVCKHSLQTAVFSEKDKYLPNVSNTTITEFDMTPAMKGTVECLYELFGGYVNSKGYKILDSHIGAIYGDSITIDRANAIWRRLVKKGFAITNATLGIGSFTYQYVTRDTFSFALKATHSIVNGAERQIFKDPITDRTAGNNFKKSQRGMCYVFKNETGEITYTDSHTLAELQTPEFENNLLKPIFRDGKLLKETTLSEIRAKLYDNKF